MKNREIYLVLADVRSAENAGAIMRTADAAGVSKIIFAGYTPAPLDRFGRARRDVAKSALGAEKSVPWERARSALSALRALKKRGFRIIAVEQSKKSIDYKKAKVSAKSAIFLGNEVKGLSKKILDEADTVLEIPMKGKKESLNVSVSAGIVLFRLLHI